MGLASSLKPSSSVTSISLAMDRMLKSLIAFFLCLADVAVTLVTGIKSSDSAISSLELCCEALEFYCYFCDWGDVRLGCITAIAFFSVLAFSAFLVARLPFSLLVYYCSACPDPFCTLREGCLGSGANLSEPIEFAGRKFVDFYYDDIRLLAKYCDLFRYDASPPLLK